MRANRVLMAVVTASVMAITLAGCGGEGDAPKVPTAGGDNASAASGKTATPGGGDDVSAYVNAQREWVKCLRENGVDALDRAAGVLRVEVADAASAKRLPTAAPSSRPEGESGRGLLLVDVLAERWGTAPRSPVGKTVWAELCLEI
ncbi:ATP-binding protein [Streptomyces coeruleorubidus]|uniref:ATP-binding protein n=1 Tax=Streptomyces coeruleorubidus TaxID=116188 RepID=UPI0036F6A1FC